MYNICNFASSSTGEPVLCINRPIELADLRIEDYVGISFTHHIILMVVVFGIIKTMLKLW